MARFDAASGIASPERDTKQAMNRRHFIRGIGAAACAASTTESLAKGTRFGPEQPPLHAADFKVFAEGGTIDLFLLIGQSNMKGRGDIDMNPVENERILFYHVTEEDWFVARDPLHATGTPDLIDGKDNAGTGPGLSFARTLLAADPAMGVGLIPAAVGGAPISGYGREGKLYERSLTLLADAVEKSPVKTRLGGLLWLQGESDATEDKHGSYEDSLLDMVDRYRKDLKEPKLPFVACTIGSFMADHPRFTHSKEINAALLRLPSKRRHTACLDARDIEGRNDRLHYDTESQLEIGRRFAKAYRVLLGS